jgi:HK97 family phage portal protein
MAFVVSSGQLSVTGAGMSPAYTPRIQPAAPWEYEMIWRTQPQVRTVIGFVARNIAQLGIHTFKRLSDTDRERLHDHPLAQVLAEPLPGMTTYRFVERLVADYKLYDNAYGIKLTLNGRLRILPVPPRLIRPRGGNWIAPDHYETAGGRDFAPSEVIHIRGYSPDTLTYGTSPIESLRDLLLESREAARQRAAMWKNGARMTGVLTRPADAPEWEPKDKRRFREMWRTFSDGGGAEGGTPILEDGMTYSSIGVSPEAAQYIDGRKLTREEVAAAYFIPPPLIGILDHATYSNIREQHKHLYQDTLGPDLVLFEQELVAGIVPDLPPEADSEGVYCEFNIAGKMRGSFEEQAAAMSTAVGGPWLTRNEGRARFNLPAVDGGDELVTPLNVTTGGLASPRDTAPDAGGAAPPKQWPVGGAKSDRPDDLGDLVDERDAFAAALKEWTQKAADVFTAAAADKGGTDPPDLLALWDAGADDRKAQLQQLLVDHGYRLAQVGAWDVLDEWNPQADGWSAEVMLAWLLAAAETHADQHQAAGRDAVATVQESGGEKWRDDLDTAAAGWVTAAVGRAATAATEARSFGGHDAAGASGLTQKVWRTGGKNPRPSHKALNGEQVAIDDVFGNGLRWPGDGLGDANETARCNCSLDYAKEA